ncbi:MAG: LysM peptidoglycan-binding domain-containing protein [Methylohalobius sp.]|nr:LysM peptidoglycan-binding domain-containing protein [Methylohalobius sp.]
MRVVWVLGIALSLNGLRVNAEEIPLAPDHPQRYTVVQGDTLWDIAARFLKQPWQWTRLWQANPQIQNPNRIYPGDVLVLTYQNGEPKLVLEREDRNSQPQRLQPQIREVPLEEAIPTIPYEAVRQFLTTPKVVTKEEIESSPYIVSLANNRLIGGSGDTVYVRGSQNARQGLSYKVFRQGRALKDLKTNEILGYNAVYIADAQLLRPGDPATFTIGRSVREVLVGDRLLPVAEETVAMDYHPHPPSRKIQGHIIEVLDSVSQIGRYSLVVIDRGQHDGLELGHVLEIWQQGNKVLDSVGKQASEWVTLPEERSGLVLIFRPFERVSYGIVMEALSPIHLGDLVKQP